VRERWTSLRQVLLQGQRTPLPAPDVRDTEILALRRSQDELSDELAELRCALDKRKAEILDAGETDLAWEEIARAAWPDETLDLWGPPP
jgi:SH3-like domain-containing protein